jgi:hypothetical protein
MRVAGSGGFAPKSLSLAEHTRCLQPSEIEVAAPSGIGRKLALPFFFLHHWAWLLIVKFCALKSIVTNCQRDASVQNTNFCKQR